MLRKYLFIATFASVAAAQATDKLQWPTGVQQESDTRVVAFYNAQCAEWADNNGLQGGARDGYIAKCLQEMPSIYPVGYEKSTGDSE